MKWFIKCLKQYADFKGRARRREYWMFVLFLFLIQFVVGVVFGLVYKQLHGSVVYQYQVQDFMRATRIMQICVALPTVLPTLAAQTRRLHDIGESGWFLPPFWVLVLIMQFLPGLIDDCPYLLIIYPIVGVLGIWLLIKLARDSKPGMNKYGANPKELEPK